MCAFQNFATNAGGTAVFQDGGGNQSTFVYLNPRICCQNNNYSSPAGNCPIGVIAQPWRKYSFRKLKIHYRPTSATTSTSGSMAVAFDPEVVTTSSLSATVMSFANFEASMYGPVWANNCLDLTPYLDRSKWFYAETSASPSTSVLAENSIQGTLLLCPINESVTSFIFGMFFMEFELALNELGPTEVFSVPALSRGSIGPSEFICSGSSSSSSVAHCAITPDKDKSVTEVVVEEYIVVDGERKLMSKTTSKV